MAKKYSVKKINGIKIAVKDTKWAVPMKPRVKGTITHKSVRWPSRSDQKSELRKQTEYL